MRLDKYCIFFTYGDPFLALDYFWGFLGKVD